ncbi:hypothetical protein Bca4012_094682 [Brassica carinata]|nr:unnamed protein product [Brassica napus]
MEVTEQSSDPPSTRPTVDFTMGGKHDTRRGTDLGEKCVVLMTEVRRRGTNLGENDRGEKCVVLMTEVRRRVTGCVSCGEKW